LNEFRAAAASTQTFDWLHSLTEMIALVRPGIDAKTFYAGKTISEVEWWISSCCKFPEFYWGRLRVFSDGTADAAFDESDVYGFRRS